MISLIFAANSITVQTVTRGVHAKIAAQLDHNILYTFLMYSISCPIIYRACQVHRISSGSTGLTVDSFHFPDSMFSDGFVVIGPTLDQIGES